MAPAMKTLDLVYFNAGGGHRAAAQALADAIATQGRPWRVRQVHLFEVIDPRGRFERLTGMAPEAYYNQRLARGWTLGLAQELKLLQAMIRLAHPTLVRRLQQHWLADEPDAVVSLVPNFNRAMQEALASALPGVPFVTVLTDLADLPPRFWIESRPGAHIVCGTPEAAAQARAQGHPADHVHRVDGVLLRRDFHAAAPSPEERRAARRDAGLPEDGFVPIVMFGGHGSRAMRTIARSLPDQPLILICGHNAVLAEAIRRLPARAPRVVLGHTPDVARWMRLADVFIGKPGPGSLSEALQCGLPVVTCRNACTLPQERFNTDWVRRHDLGVVITDFDEIAPALEAVRRRAPALRAAVARIRNDAARQIPELLAGLLDPAPALGIALPPALAPDTAATVGPDTPRTRTTETPR